MRHRAPDAAFLRRRVTSSAPRAAGTCATRTTIRSSRRTGTRSRATAAPKSRGIASGLERPSMSLFRRAVAVNVTVLVAAVLLLALSPATVSANVTLSEWIVLAAGTAAVIVVNLLLLRRVFGPLERLEQVMGRIDPHEPGRRIAEDEGAREIAGVSRAFNSMLDRLERERADGRRRALRAQEAERGRVARELHDELGQLLTGVVLQLEGLTAAVPSTHREGGRRDPGQRAGGRADGARDRAGPSPTGARRVRASRVARGARRGLRRALRVEGAAPHRSGAAGARRRDGAGALSRRPGGDHERRSPRVCAARWSCCCGPRTTRSRSR